MKRISRVKWMTALALMLAVLGLYWQTRTFEFIKFDDADYVVENRHVIAGLTSEGIRWAFSNRWSANWQPVTWISLMADVSLFGVNAGAMHLVNAVLHSIAAGMLFLFLLQILSSARGAREAEASSTRDVCVCSAACFAAAFWAVHPLRVESVAWVSSRKDVLSAIFCLSGLMAWLADVRADWGGQPRETGWRVFARPGVACPEASGPEGLMSGRRPPQAATGYGRLALVCFILGYMSKPTMMVFPAFAMLLEWYETGRVRWRPLAAFAVIAGAFLLITVYAQTEAMSAIPLGRRAGNAAESIVVYIRQMVMPVRLSVFYPYFPWAWSGVVIGMLTVIGLIAGAWHGFTKVPLVSFVIAWFGMGLLPVIGLIAVGSASHADRYTYLPAIGISIGLAVAVKRLFEKLEGRREARDALTSILIVIGLAYAVAAWRYIRVWENTFLLAGHAVESEPRNAWMWQWLGDEYINRFSDPDQAIACYRRSRALNADTDNTGLLAITLALRGADGDVEEVKRLCAGFIGHEEKDTLGASLSALAIVAMREMRWQEAIRLFEESFTRKTKPRDFANVWYAMCLYNVQRYAQAERVFAAVSEHASDPIVRKEAQARLETVRQKLGIPPEERQILPGRRD